MSLLSDIAALGSRVRDAVLNKYGDETERISTATKSSVTYDRLPNPSPIISEHAPQERQQLYFRMRRQIPFVGGFCKIRVRAIENLQHDWMAGDENDGTSRMWRDRCDAAWADIPDRRAAFQQIMLAPFDGVSFAQYVYAAYQSTVADDGGAFTSADLVIPTRIIDAKPWLFEFRRDGALMLYGTNTVMPELQMLIARAGSSDYYGEPEMDGIYNDVWMYDQIQGMGLEQLEKQGIPMALVIYPEAWQSDAGRLADIKRSIRATYKNVMMVPMGDRFDVTFPSQSVAPTFVGSDQTDRLRLLQGSISVSLLGAEYSKSQVGSQARDVVQNEMRTDLFATDAAVYDGAANNWRDRVMMINDPALPKPLWPYHQTATSQGENLRDWIERLKLAQDVGFKASADQIAEVQGFEMGDMEKKEAPNPFAPQSPAADPNGPPDNQTIVELPNQDETDESVTMMSESTGELFRFASRERARRFFAWV